MVPVLRYDLAGDAGIHRVVSGRSRNDGEALIHTLVSTLSAQLPSLTDELEAWCREERLGAGVGLLPDGLLTERPRCLRTMVPFRASIDMALQSQEESGPAHTRVTLSVTIPYSTPNGRYLTGTVRCRHVHDDRHVPVPPGSGAGTTIMRVRRTESE